MEYGMVHGIRNRSRNSPNMLKPVTEIQEWNMLKPERELRNGFKLAKPRNSINNIYQVNLFSRQSLRRLTLIYRIKGSKNTKEYSKNDNYV